MKLLRNAGDHVLCVGFKHCAGICFFDKNKVLHIAYLAPATALHKEENNICWQSTHRFEAHVNNSETQPSKTARPLINHMKAAMWTKNTFCH